MLIRMSAGNLNAYVALAGFVGGVFTGTAALKRGFSLGRSYESQSASGYVLPVLLVLILILSVTTSLMAVSEKGPGSMHAPVLIALVGGLVFGAVSQKCRTCFAGSFRDVILMKNFDLITIIGAFFAVMLLFNMVTGGFKLSFDGQPVAHAQHLWNILGMYVVGFAAVLAGDVRSGSWCWRDRALPIPLSPSWECSSERPSAITSDLPERRQRQRRTPRRRQQEAREQPEKPRSSSVLRCCLPLVFCREFSGKKIEEQRSGGTPHV